MRKILTTSALIYANGPLHLGHILEQIQADIWVRWQKLQGNDCLYLCGDDAHGTPVMISAQQKNIKPEQLISEVKTSHEQDSAGFLIDFDNYHTTHSPENRELVNLVYQRLQQKGSLETKTIQQAFDPTVNMFLPDRYIRGTCPRCGAHGQHGDNCENCGATYAPTDLVDPVSIISGKTPIQKESEHYFFLLDKYTAMLKVWARKSLQSELVNKLNEWFALGLRPWDISRDAPYFGFEIPDKPSKYFYVWLDAPLGYIANFKNLSAQKNLDFAEYWYPDSKTELYHVIGKDIVYFHALFWPAMLEGADMRKPTSLFAHGYLTINGQKMSKSRNTFILACDYLKHLDPEYLRYYFAAKLGPGIDDIDLNFTDFVQRINSDLVGKVINIASRSAGFINRDFAGMLADDLAAPQLYAQGLKLAEKIGKLYEKRDFNNAIRHIMQLADLANKYIDEQKPWFLTKQDPQAKAIQNSCTMCLNLFRLLMIFLKPVIPKLVERAENFLQVDPLTWEQRDKPLLNHKIGKFQPLLQRVDPQDIESLLA